MVSDHSCARMALSASLALALSACSFSLDPGASFGSLTTQAGRAVSYVGPSEVGGPTGGPIPRLFAGECLLQGNENAFLGALAPIALNFAVDSLGKVLQRAGAEKAVAVYAAHPWRTPGALQNPADSGGAAGAGAGIPISGASGNQGAATGSRIPIPDCVQFVLGEFAGNEADAAIDPAFLAQLADGTGRSVDPFRTAMFNKGLFIKGRPTLFLEAALISGESGNHYLRPTILAYDRSIDTGQRAQERGLFVEFGLNAAPNALTTDKASKGVLTLGAMAPGAEPIIFLPGDPRASVMAWSKPPLGADTAGVSEFNIEMRVVEVRDARPVIAALGDLLVGEQGDQLAEGIRKDLFPTDAEQNAVITGRIQALGVYQTAIASYRRALETQSAAVTAAASRPTAEQTAIKAEQDAIVEAARLAARLAAAGAGVPSAI